MLQGLISHAEIIERHAPDATPVDHGFSSSPSRLLSSGSLEGAYPNFLPPSCTRACQSLVLDVG